MKIKEQIIKQKEQSAITMASLAMLNYNYCDKCGKKIKACDEYELTTKLQLLCKKCK